MFKLSPIFIICAITSAPVSNSFAIEPLPLLPHSSTLIAATAASRPPAQLAEVYQAHRIADISQYLVSEKYDGVRAFWTGTQLVTRAGNPISAPVWFTEQLPNVPLDGELWIAREAFDRVSGIVRTLTPNHNDWQQVKYMVFDSPAAKLTFAQRYQRYQHLINAMQLPHVHAVTQQQFHSQLELNAYFNAIISEGAEGIMLHLASAHHTPGRTNALLKLKPYFDAEAEVIAYLPGKGKYTGMVGALRVRNSQGQEFSLGSGLSDAQRASPPAIGSIVSYKYHGYTANGIPRFASFLRIHLSSETQN